MGKTITKRMKALALIVTFVFVGITSQAQNIRSSNLISWFRNQGIEYLAGYAHFNNPMQSYEIISTSSSNIIVRIYFEGFLVDYSSKYEVEIGSYNGQSYFKNVRVMSEGCARPSFNAWEDLPKAYSVLYDSDFEDLYGSSYWGGLSSGRKAACALFMEFLAYYLD